MTPMLESKQGISPENNPIKDPPESSLKNIPQGSENGSALEDI